MDSDYKWFAIMVSVVFSALAIGMGFDQWQKTDCKVKLGQSNHTVVEINEICK